ALFAANPGFFGHVLKLAVAVIMKQTHAARFADGQIGVAVTVEIACSAAESRADAAQTGLLRDIFKLAVTEIVEEAALAFARADQEKIGFAVPVIIEEAHAAAGTDGRSRRQAIGQRLLRVMNGNLRRGCDRRAVDKFRERVFALISVARAEWHAELLGIDSLEPLHRFTGGHGVTLPLVGARNSEPRRSVKGRERQRFLECGNRFVIALQLRIYEALKIEGIRLFGHNFLH